MNKHYDYEAMWGNLKKVAPSLHESLVAKCQENLWLRRSGILFENDPYLELDSPYSFVEVEELETLEVFFYHGNWSIRQGIVYGDLVFINQVNGGDECKRQIPRPIDTRNRPTGRRRSTDAERQNAA